VNHEPGDDENNTQSHRRTLFCDHDGYSLESCIPDQDTLIHSRHASTQFNITLVKVHFDASHSRPRAIY